MMTTSDEGLCQRLRALVIMDEVGSNNMTAKEAAARIEALIAERDAAVAWGGLCSELDKIAALCIKRTKGARPHNAAPDEWGSK